MKNGIISLESLMRISDSLYKIKFRKNQRWIYISSQISRVLLIFLKPKENDTNRNQKYQDFILRYSCACIFHLKKTKIFKHRFYDQWKRDSFFGVTYKSFQNLIKINFRKIKVSSLRIQNGFCWLSDMPTISVNFILRKIMYIL